MSQSLYVFDMDDTLINGDCAVLWHEFLVEQGVVTQPDFLVEDRRLMTLYAKGEMNMQDYLMFSIEPLRHLTVSAVKKLAEQCVEEKILSKWFPQAKNLIHYLSQQQQAMLVISASATFLVETVAKKMGIDDVIGVDLVIESNSYTPQILGTPSYQQGKVTRLMQWREHCKQNFSHIHFYTDSINDLPLCNYADFTYLVNPCERLATQANGKPWQILSWR